MSFNLKRCAVKLKQRFGSTQDMTKSGLMLPDGTIIPTWSPSMGYGRMGPTHGSISVWMENKCKVDEGHEDFNTGLDELMNAGVLAYRFIGKPGKCDVSADLGSGKFPSSKQMRLIRDAKEVCGDFTWAIHHRWGEFCAGGTSWRDPRWRGKLREQWEGCNKTYEELKGP